MICAGMNKWSGKNSQQSIKCPWHNTQFHRSEFEVSFQSFE